MFSSIWHACQSIFNHIKDSIKKWTKPVTATLAAGIPADLTRNRQDLLVENAMATTDRSQTLVKRPKFTNGDRARLSLLTRLTDFWQSALFLVQPDTILRWHRELFRLY